MQPQPSPRGGAKLRSGLPERNTWAMWVGSKSSPSTIGAQSLTSSVFADVPADATEGELWVFFNQRPPLLDDKAPLESVTGIESLHLIARCAIPFRLLRRRAKLSQTRLTSLPFASSPKGPTAPSSTSSPTITSSMPSHTPTAYPFAPPTASASRSYVVCGCVRTMPSRA